MIKVALGIGEGVGGWSCKLVEVEVASSGDRGYKLWK